MFLALIPYFSTPVWEIPLPGMDPLVLDSWALLVAAGFVVGMEIARWRGIRLGLDTRDVVDGIVFIVALGFFGGHVMHVVGYHPEIYAEDGIMSILRFWEGFSSMGGFLGAVLATVLFYRGVRKRPFWIHADNVVFALPFGWFLGRMGCFTAHDHIGKPSDFFLAVDFPGIGPRHDLGLYEALVTALIAAVFWATRHTRMRHGIYTALFALLYAPVRFGLDFLRSTDLQSSDLRWGGLTPAQWLSIAMMLGGAAVVVRLLRLGPPGPDEQSSAVTDGAPASRRQTEDAKPASDAP